MSCQKNLVSVLAFEWLKLPLDHTQLVICLQGIAGSGKGGWLGSQESCQLVIHGLLSLPLVDEGIGQGFQYEGLIAYRLCQAPKGGGSGSGASPWFPPLFWLTS